MLQNGAVRNGSLLWYVLSYEQNKKIKSSRNKSGLTNCAHYFAWTVFIIIKIE